MRLKRGVNASRVHPDLWALLGQIDAQHWEATGRVLVVTSLRRRPGRRPSLHSPRRTLYVRAADLRRHALDEREGAERFCQRLQRLYGDYLGVVLEPEWLEPAQIRQRGGSEKIAPHIHVQLKRRRWPRVG